MLTRRATTTITIPAEPRRSLLPNRPARTAQQWKSRRIIPGSCRGSVNRCEAHLGGKGTRGAAKFREAARARRRQPTAGKAFCLGLGDRRNVGVGRCRWVRGTRGTRPHQHGWTAHPQFWTRCDMPRRRRHASRPMPSARFKPTRRSQQDRASPRQYWGPRIGPCPSECSVRYVNSE